MLSDYEFWGLYVPCVFAHNHLLPVNKTVELGNTSFGKGFGLPWMEKTRYSTLTQQMFEPLSKVSNRSGTGEIDFRKNKIAVPAAHWYNVANKEYLAIDINGQHGALKHDLQIELPSTCPRNYYEMLLDFGTIEHVKKQYNAWKNCHDLVKPGGLMIHSLPADREGSWEEHCYHWYTTQFFEELSLKCGYEVRLLDEVKTIWREPADYQIWACLRKSNNNFISEDEFLEIMSKDVRSEYGAKTDGSSRHGIPLDQGDLIRLGDV